MARITALIHPQGNSEGSLKEAIAELRPKIVFLISNPDANRAKLVLKYVQGKNISKLGKWVNDIEHSELIEIENAFSEDTVLQMVGAIMKAKEKAKEMAGKDVVECHVGLAGGTKLMVIGAAIAAIEAGTKSTYYVTEDRIERPGGVIRIDFISNLTKSLAWLRGHYKNRGNLVYLEETIKREQEGTLTASGPISKAVGRSERSVRNAMQQLKLHGLVDFDSKVRTREYSSTDLGKFVLGLIGAPEGDE